ncbi:Tetratricopeptide repeat-containing protein [Paracidovorax avenae ATCC 19860]|uniref:Tetratricopeptide repeat-containing protein n=1 Tax=Paracidovorax avenae (strain ATCC 19860 / DSM 7227 / CCUG 15838 / JCM 20985 / LMG 2117 / NCPPB 1011) TaxID=643561 RepID=F0QBR2_PARA1|nr:tetratricopeptide repeat protein [Paracidovorax avenae]ADX47421.1 Tetratricopeptide repeat-containing protein [Paracidovorax avenae ATCC 19860]
MDYYESMEQSHRLRSAAFLCALCAVAAPSFAAPAAPPPPSARAPQAELQVENIPNSEARAALDAELFYDILVGELSTSQGDPGTGYALMLEAARRSGDAQLYRRATEIALQSRSGEYALAAARAWKEAQPQSREANRYLLQILIALNRIPETGDLLRQELAQSPAKDRLLTLQAIPQLYGRAPDKAAAAAIVEKALADQLENPAAGPLAWTALGRMRLAAGDRKGALEAARKALAQEPTLDAAALLSLQLMEAGEADAEPLVARYMGGGKPQPEIRMAYAGVLLNLQRYSEAGTQVDLLTREAPDMAEAWLLKATLALQSDRLQESEAALEQFERLLQSYPPADPRKAAIGQAYLLRSQIAEKRGDLAQAEAWLGKIENSAELLAAQTRRASLLARQGKLDEGIALIRRLPARNPLEERQKLVAEAQLLRDAKQYQKAFEVQGKAVAMAPEDYDLAYDQAMLAEKAGDLAGMERLLRQIIEKRPDYHHAYNALGYSLAERGIRLQEARQLIQKALTYAPKDPFITDSLGWVEFRLGNHAEAARLLGDAFQRQPDPEIAAHLGEVLWTMGERSRALEVWRTGLQLNKDNETLQETIKRLKAVP